MPLIGGARGLARRRQGCLLPLIKERGFVALRSSAHADHYWMVS